MDVLTKAVIYNHPQTVRKAKALFDDWMVNKTQLVATLTFMTDNLEYTRYIKENANSKLSLICINVCGILICLMLLEHCLESPSGGSGIP